jgi:hypothetical protein
MATAIEMDKVPGIGLIRSITQKLAHELEVDISLYKSFIDNNYGDEYILYLYLKKAENKNEIVVARLNQQILLDQDAPQIRGAILNRLKKTNIRGLMGSVT